MTALPPKVKLHSRVVQSTAWQSCTNRARSLFELLWTLAGPPELGDRDQIILHCKVKRTTLARRLGRSLSSVARALSELRDSNLIATATSGRCLGIVLFPPPMEVVAPLLCHTRGVRFDLPEVPDWHTREVRFDPPERSDLTPRLKGNVQWSLPAAAEQRTDSPGSGGGSPSGPAAAAAAAAAALIAALRQFGISEPARSAILGHPGLTLGVLQQAGRRWRQRAERGPVGSGLLLRMIHDCADSELERRYRRAGKPVNRQPASAAVEPDAAAFGRRLFGTFPSRSSRAPNAEQGRLWQERSDTPAGAEGGAP